MSPGPPTSADMPDGMKSAPTALPKGVTNWHTLDYAFFEFPKAAEICLSVTGAGLEGAQCERFRRWLSV